MATWTYKSSQDRQEIEDFVNDFEPDLGGIQGAISGPDIHVWIRNDKSGKHYTFVHTIWNDNERDKIELLIEQGKACVIGFSHNDFWYLKYLG